MKVAGAYITVPGGGGDLSGFAPDVTTPESMRIGVVTNADDTRLKVRYLFQHGADFIKLIATGAVQAEPLVTAEFPLQRAGEAIRALAEPGSMKVLVTP